MSNDLSYCHRQVAGVSPEPDAAAKESRPKWRERLQRELFKIWLIFSALWVACILLILSMRLRALVRLAPAAMRRPARQSCRDIYRRFRHRISTACRRAIVVSAGHRSFETRSAQAIGIGHCPTAGIFSGRRLVRPPGGALPTTPCSIPKPAVGVVTLPGALPHSLYGRCNSAIGAV